MRTCIPILLFSLITLVGCDTSVTEYDTEQHDPVVMTADNVVMNDALGKKTTVPGHSDDRYDQDNNGFPDAGVYVNGHYTSLYAYDAAGDWYWDLGDGRVQASVGVDDVSDLDQSTLSTCNYVNNYRADFGNDAFMNEGWIQNHIRCSGYDGKGHYNYLIVSQTDPRYTGNPDWAVWGTWEYHVLTISGQGNLVRLSGPQNNTGS